MLSIFEISRKGQFQNSFKSPVLLPQKITELGIMAFL